MLWSELKEKYKDPEFGYVDVYSIPEEQLMAEVWSLGPAQLALALQEVRGCGCCVDGEANNFRPDIIKRVIEVLNGISTTPDHR